MDNTNANQPNAKELHDKFWSSLARRVYASPHDIKCLTADEQTFFAVRLFKAELDNGGIDQFFYNSSGDYFKEVVAGLKKLGARQTCELLVIGGHVLFGVKGPPPDRRNRSDALFSPLADRCSDALDALETAMDDSDDDLSAKLAAFVDSKGLMVPRTTEPA